MLRNLVTDTTSNIQGIILFNSLKEAFLNEEQLILEVDSNMPISSSFLNSSVGEFLDNYGINNFKKTIKFKGTKSQFQQLSNYISKYNQLYLVNSL